MSDLPASFEASRGRLMGLAYRMLGSRADAEDILQDAFLRILKRPAEQVRNAEAYLVTLVTRLCLDQARSARARREVYVGPWLPEPILDQEETTPESLVELADDLSFALLLTLERLTPAERAAFLLHDVFDLSFKEVADTLERSEAACRQLAARARRAVAESRPGRPATPEAHRDLLRGFAEALASGDASRLGSLLKADVVAYADGGGVKLAALRPILGADRVARFFLGITRKAREEGRVTRFEERRINGQPGFLVYLDGALDQSLTIAVDAGRIQVIYVVRNPDKLAGLWGGAEAD